MLVNVLGCVDLTFPTLISQTNACFVFKITFDNLLLLLQDSCIVCDADSCTLNHARSIRRLDLVNAKRYLLLLSTVWLLRNCCV